MVHYCLFFPDIDLIAQSRKIFRPQSSDDEIVLADETDHVWDPDWSHPSIISIPTDLSSTAITTVFVNKNYVRITPPTIAATPLDYNAIFTDRTGNISLNSTIIITQEKRYKTKIFTQHNI